MLVTEKYASRLFIPSIHSPSSFGEGISNEKVLIGFEIKFLCILYLCFGMFHNCICVFVKMKVINPQLCSLMLLYSEISITINILLFLMTE